jgi:DNA-directed RNA polymerase subunit RPC12/RpoP
MATQTMRSFRLKACVRCGGDAYLDLRDDPEWRCLQCGRLILTEAMPIRLAATETQQQKAA